MNNAWIALESAPAGSLKNKIHGYVILVVYNMPIFSN